ncbi:nucleotidyltransferase family protein [Jatrophihabitans cynanchi]|jgi:molybdenum cofactor cytidylyltransferase/nicotine blue oxidoreductase|uniref:Nucleotidyltransferase family protein n=1 Tax=Jatrophihabitans cynanchi TaxID=2944128 RepID=A0ABY7K204_9ACTN|nr:nucleotidyltransferase family protein [Jatrophihabitans sp. SB3-54]WAX57602.1 nucleotidyltransferase family protein [Jatrophihabitans sp. SB3-54]
MSRVAGVVLAAGSGSRMGVPKAALVVGGAALLERAVRALADGGCAPIVAVVRAGARVPEPARGVVNPEPERGMRSSLELGVDAAGAADAVAVLLVDTPGIGADAVRAVVRAWTPGRIAVGCYAGRRGHPTVMSAELWREALTLAAPDEGARALLAARPDLVDETAVPGRADDLDTPEDVARWESGGTAVEA